MPGRQRPEDEILHRRLGGGVRRPVHRHHRVQRQAQELEAEIERDEAAGRDHHHHPEQREQRQHERLAAEEAAVRAVAARIEQHQRDGDAAHELERVGEHVVDDHAGRRRPPAAAASSRAAHHAAAASTDLRQPERHVAPRVVEEQIDQQHRRRRRRGAAISGRTAEKSRFVISGRHDSRHSLLCATCASRSATEPCMTSMKGFG